MRTLASLLAAAVIAAFGLTGTAFADPFADPPAENLVTFGDVSGDNNDGGLDATGPDNGNAAVNTTFTSLGWDGANGGTLVLRFTDNVCLNGADPDFTVFEVGVGEGGADEPYDVSVGLIGGGLTSAGSGVGDDIFNSPVAAFNRISITGTGDLTGTTSGPDIDAVECFFTLDQLDIEKAFADNPQDGGALDEIDVRVKGETAVGDQQFKAFTIKITNNTGINTGFAGLTFFDAVPAEYDLDPDGESPSLDATNNDCADGVCNGIAEDANGKCTVTADVPNGAKAGHGGNKLRSKLEPELLSIDASALMIGEMCTTTVFVKTDLGDHKKMYTPTSCPVDLNSGVKVFDALKNLLLQDDDQLIFDDGAGGLVGTCNDVLDND